MKRIGKSKELTLQAIQNIPGNLREKFRRTFFLGIRSSVYNDTNSRKLEYHISILPGTDGTDCTVVYFRTWSKVLDYYHKLIKEGLKDEKGS